MRKLLLMLLVSGMPGPSHAAPLELKASPRLWVSQGTSRTSLQVSALNPGSKKLGLELRKDEGGGYAIDVSAADGYRRTVRITPALKLKTE